MNKLELPRSSLSGRENNWKTETYWKRPTIFGYRLNWISPASLPTPFLLNMTAGMAVHLYLSLSISSLFMTYKLTWKRWGGGETNSDEADMRVGGSFLNFFVPWRKVTIAVIAGHMFLKNGRKVFLNIEHCTRVINLLLRYYKYLRIRQYIVLT